MGLNAGWRRNRRRRKDVNHDAIVAALRAAGRVVESIADVGRGVPDLLVVTPHGYVILLEIKSPGERLTPKERDWHAKFAPAATTGSLAVVTTPQEAIEATR